MDYYVVHGAGIFIVDPWYSNQDGPGIFAKQYRMLSRPDLVPQRRPGAIFLPDVYDLGELEKAVIHHAQYVGYHVKFEFEQVIADKDMDDYYPNERVYSDERDSDGDKVFQDWFKPFVPLYEPVKSEQYTEWVPAEGFKCLGKFEVDNMQDPANFKVLRHRDDQWRNEAPKIEPVDLSSVVDLYTLEKMMVPEFLHHLRPCVLSSQNFYKIVRAYIKTNIDNNRAVITSDYDFCFSVKRRRYHDKPVIRKTEIKTASGRSYKTPKFSTKTETNVLEDIFEMSHDRAGSGNRGPYNGYTAMPKLEADNLQDMYDRITVYLTQLLTVINAYSASCPECGGHGFIEKQEKFTLKAI